MTKQRILDMLNSAYHSQDVVSIHAILADIKTYAGLLPMPNLYVSTALITDRVDEIRRFIFKATYHLASESN